MKPSTAILPALKDADSCHGQKHSCTGNVWSSEQSGCSNNHSTHNNSVVAHRNLIVIILMEKDKYQLLHSINRAERILVQRCVNMLQGGTKVMHLLHQKLLPCTQRQEGSSTQAPYLKQMYLPRELQHHLPVVLLEQLQFYQRLKQRPRYVRRQTAAALLQLGMMVP